MDNKQLNSPSLPQAFSDAISNAIHNGSGITEIKLDDESSAILFRSHGEIRIAVDPASPARATDEN